MKKHLTILALCLALPGCASGPVYSSSLLPPVNHQGAQLVIYKMNGFSGSAANPSIIINGKETCDLPNGSFFPINISSNEADISIKSFGMNAGERNFSLPKARRTYVKISTNIEKALASGFGLAGDFTYSAATQQDPNNGSYRIDVVTAAQAQQELQGLKQSLTCK